MSLLASETQNKVIAVNAALTAVEEHLEPLFAKHPADIGRKLSPLENAELSVTLAYSVASLYFCHLLTQGVDPSEHPIRQELDRIQMYFKKLRTTADEVAAKTAESQRIRVDAEAARRIVEHYTEATAAAAQRISEARAAATARPSSGAPPHKKPRTQSTPEVARATEEVSVESERTAEAPAVPNADARVTVETSGTSSQAKTSLAKVSPGNAGTMATLPEPKVERRKSCGVASV